MTTLRQDLLDRVRRVLHETFMDDRLAITEDTKFADIPEWDSILHVTLIMTLEREFNVRLSAREASESIAIRPVLDVLENKLKTRNDPANGA
jgi:acyl carrier protein